MQENIYLKQSFLQIPGPNPILVRGAKNAWDEKWLEACDVFKDVETYYLYYHGHAAHPGEQVSRGLGYQIGLATASHPLGPWKKYEGNPVLQLGEQGSWDDMHVACASIIRVEAEKYYMWYSGMSEKDRVEGYQGHIKWSVGLATASHPLGPWKKHDANPIIEDFGYVGGVIKLKNKYYMYNQHPHGLTGPDYGPISLATAENPEGPWKIENRPVLFPEESGGWDDGGYSEAEVVYRDGVFHMFYGGAKLHPVRIQTRESIGYAYSFDGHEFFKYSGNPVALREKDPDASAFAEIHSLIEPPFIYLYHTLRYISRPELEDIGVQVLATSRPFRLPVPVLNLGSIEAGTGTELNDSPAISLENISDLAVSVECAYSAEARNGLRIHIKASSDGINYDTEDLYAFDNDFIPGRTVSKTVELNPKAMFVKIIAQNLSETEKIADVKVTATLSNMS